MLFEQLESVNARPEPFSIYTAEDLWADPHISKQMLRSHLNGDVALASRTTSFIERSLRWVTQLASLEQAARSRILDLGCGPGLYANRLTLTGAEVIGVDFSERSIRHASGSANQSASPIAIGAISALGYLTGILDLNISEGFSRVSPLLMATFIYLAATGVTMIQTTVAHPTTAKTPSTR